MQDPYTWYLEIPIVSRVYLTASFLTTAACALDVVSPFSLYYDYTLIFYKGQTWRLLSNFFFFGLFGLDFLFHMYFLVRYCRLLEEGEFRGRTGDFVVMLAFGSALMLVAAPFLSIHFLGSSLAFMMVYVWGRRNEHVRMSFLGLFPFNAPYLPWVMLAFSLLLGNPATTDLIGIAVGHFYYYLEYVYPVVADVRGWRLSRVLGLTDLLRGIPDLRGPAFPRRRPRRLPRDDDEQPPNANAHHTGDGGGGGGGGEAAPTPPGQTGDGGGPADAADGDGLLPGARDRADGEHDDQQPLPQDARRDGLRRRHVGGALFAQDDARAQQ